MNDIVQTIDLAQERFVKIAPKQMDYEAEKGFAIQLLTNNNYLSGVAEQHKASLLQPVTNVAAIGLSLNPAKKQAYLITRKVKNGNQWENRIFLEPSYMGLCDLATMSGTIEWIQAAPVYSEDTYINKGPGSKPEHNYSAFGDRGEFQGVYCIAKTSKGDYLVTEMDKAAVESIRDRSEAWKSFKAGRAKTGGPWQSDFIEMAKKTVVRQAFKMWPKSEGMERLHEAINMSNQNEGFEEIKTAPDLKDHNPEQKKYYDQLMQSNDALGMYVFMESLEFSVTSSLYHSFEKGTKGRYQRISDDLYKKGFEVFNRIFEGCLEACEKQDEYSFKELIEDLPQAVTSLLSERLNSAWFDEALKNGAK